MTLDDAMLAGKSISQLYCDWVFLQNSIEEHEEENTTLFDLLEAEIVLGDLICSSIPCCAQDFEIQKAVRSINGIET